MRLYGSLFPGFQPSHPGRGSRLDPLDPGLIPSLALLLVLSPSLCSCLTLQLLEKTNGSFVWSLQRLGLLFPKCQTQADFRGFHTFAPLACLCGGPFGGHLSPGWTLAGLEREVRAKESLWEEPLLSNVALPSEAGGSRTSAFDGAQSRASDSRE